LAAILLDVAEPGRYNVAPSDIIEDYRYTHWSDDDLQWSSFPPARFCYVKTMHDGT